MLRFSASKTKWNIECSSDITLLSVFRQGRVSLGIFNWLIFKMSKVPSALFYKQFNSLIIELNCMACMLNVVI